MNIEILGFADPLSSWSHLLSAVAAAVGAYFLVKKGQGNGWRVFSLCVYSFTLIFLFSMSGVFHLLPRESVGRDVLQRLDHAAIWCLIAGTFTPIHAILFRGVWRWLILAFIWTVAITGLVLEVVFFTTFPEWLALSFFIGLGWVGCLSHYKFRKFYPQQSPRLIVFGGLSYTVGAVMDFNRWFTIWPQILGPHEIFHFFIILGAAFHWVFIEKWANHPVSDRFLCDVRILSNGLFTLSSPNDSLNLESNSLEELKTRATEIITRRFHHASHFEIIFRYFNEEHLVIHREPSLNDERKSTADVLNTKFTEA